MRWFQVDSDTPNDPRIRAVLRVMGNEGLGALFRLWCHIANHGRAPGFSETSTGAPMPVEELVEACGLTPEQFDALVALCALNGHFVEREWSRKRVIAIPAMSRRADTYTKRGVRTQFAHGANKVRHTRQDNTRQDKTPPTPLSRGARVTREHIKQAGEILRLRFGHCSHQPPCAGHATCKARLARDLADKAATA